MREDTAKQQPEEPAPKPEPEPIESEPDSERDKERSAQKSENSGDATDESHETPTVRWLYLEKFQFFPNATVR